MPQEFPPEPKPAAVVILRRDDGAVYLVKRPKASRFFPGFHAFPGGALEPEDGPEPTLAALTACAARELQEEVRVGLKPDALEPAGRVVTPPFSPIRYDTQFFVAALPRGQEPVPQEPELAGGGWFDPADALAAWKAGSMRIPPPVIHWLEVLEAEGPQAALAKGTDEQRFPIAFASGLRVEPLAVGTLPPHTHTNAFVVGQQQLAVIDPGASGDALAPLLDALAWLEDEQGADVVAVALTHHHEDHVAGLVDVLAAFGCELAASEATAARLDHEVDRVLEDGDVIELGEHRLEVVATPGHAPGHLAFHVPSSRAILAGDLVAGIGTVLVPPGEGDMAAYMASLERLAKLAEDRGARLLFPAHGPPSFKPGAKLRETLEHRRMREKRVLEAVGQRQASLEAIAEAAYQDKPEAPAELARMSAKAHLDKLEAEGRIERVGDAWSLHR